MDLEEEWGRDNRGTTGLLIPGGGDGDDGHSDDEHTPMKRSDQGAWGVQNATPLQWFWSLQMASHSVFSVAYISRRSTLPWTARVAVLGFIVIVAAEMSTLGNGGCLSTSHARPCIRFVALTSLVYLLLVPVTKAMYSELADFGNSYQLLPIAVGWTGLWVAIFFLVVLNFGDPLREFLCRTHKRARWDDDGGDFDDGARQWDDVDDTHMHGQEGNDDFWTDAKNPGTELHGTLGVCVCCAYFVVELVANVAFSWVFPAFDSMRSPLARREHERRRMSSTFD